MTTTTPPNVRAATLAELRAAVLVGDEQLEIGRQIRLSGIRNRLAAASPGPWTAVQSLDGIIRVHRNAGAASYSRIANMLRSGHKPAQDAALIAHGRADLEWALDEIARVRAERDLLLKHATPEAQVAYWTLRAEARGQELEARR
jgi:hypothetical protein